MSELVKFGGAGLPANPEDLVKGLQNVGQTLQGSTGGMPLLRLLKSGMYAYGPENIEPEEGSEWAINPYSLAHGFACWGDGELLDERMVPFNQTPPMRSELPDYGHEWNQQVAMQMQCMNGEDEGTVVLYKGTSTGLRNAVKQLIDQIIAQAQVDVAHIVPVVQLECDSYQHKKYGEIFYPILDIEHWLNVEDGATAPDPVEDQSETAGEPADEGESEPAEAAAEPAQSRRRRRKAAAEAPAAEEAKPSSNRRRRRKAS